MGSKEGALKSHELMKQRLGPEGYKAYMASIAAKGGKATVPKGLSFTRGVQAKELHKPRHGGTE